MDRSVYQQMAEQDGVHWWYRARRDVLASLIARRVALRPQARILEIGCGTGHNLAMLGTFGQVDAIEIDDDSRALSERRLGRTIGRAPLPDLAGFDGGDYDLIAVLDVIEHVEADCAALATLRDRLVPGGTVLITVPQHPWMWSGHDVANHHFRRYTKASLRAVIEAAGLKTMLLQSFNSLLFPAAVTQRLIQRLTGREGIADALPPAPVNFLFDRIFAAERHLVGRVPMPTGLSLVALAQSPR